MTPSTSSLPTTNSGRLRRRLTGPRPLAMAVVSVFALGSLVALTLAGSAEAVATTVPLGTASSFAILAGGGITNTGPTTVNGDIGTFPTTSETGSAFITQTGTDHAGDAVTQGAKSDLVTAYNNAAGQGPSTSVGGDLVGLTLAPGVYNNASALGLTGSVTLDGQNDPDAVFVSRPVRHSSPAPGAVST